MKKQIDLVMFDLGRVLVDFDFRKVIAGLRKHSTLSEKQIHHFFKTTPLWDAFERGQIRPEAFFKEMQRELRLNSLTLEGFAPLWNDIFQEMPESIEILRTLKRRYRTALVSNVNVMHWEFIRGRHSFLDWFDLLIASYAVGHRKPDVEIYRIALARANVPPERAVFVDDVESHITSAKSIGIHAVQFQSATQLRKHWEDLLHD